MFKFCKLHMQMKLNLKIRLCTGVLFYQVNVTAMNETLSTC